MADFCPVELSHGPDRFQHIKYYGKPPELNDFDESSELLGGLTAIDSLPIGSAAMTFEGVTYAEVISNGLTPTGVPA